MGTRRGFHHKARQAKKALAIAWRQFLRLFPEPEDCVDYLYKMALENGFVRCGICECTAVQRNRGDRVGYCTQCKEQIWFTSETLFDHVKNPQAWLGAVWVMERGLIPTSSAFASVVGIAPSSALMMLKKLRLVICGEMAESTNLVSSRIFTALFCKRSQETPARAHPSAEQDEVDKNQPFEQAGGSSPKDVKSGRSSSIANDAPVHGPEFDPGKIEKDAGADAHVDLAKIERTILSHLSKEQLSIDALCEATQLTIHEVSATLTMMELSGAVVRSAGERYHRTAEERHSSSGYSTGVTDELKAEIDNAIEELMIRFHGTSRKAIQYYLGAFWCYKDRKRWNNGALLMACLRFGPINDAEIIAYVSPPVVKFVGQAVQTESPGTITSTPCYRQN